MTIGTTQSTVRLSQPHNQQHFVPTQPAGFAYQAQPHPPSHGQAQQLAHGGPSDYEQGLETGIGLRRQDPQPTMQQIQAQQMMHQQQQQQRGQQQHPQRSSSTVNGQPPLAQAQQHLHHQPQHPQHPQQAHPHTQQMMQQHLQQQQGQPGYPVGNGHLVGNHAQHPSQSSPPPPAGHHSGPHHFQPGPSPGGHPQAARARPPTLQVQTALSGSGMPIAPPFLSPAAANSNQMQQQQQQQQQMAASSSRQGRNQQQQYQQQLQLQQQQMQQMQQQAGGPPASASSTFAPGGSQQTRPQATGGPGPSSVAMAQRGQQLSSSQGTDSRIGSSKGRGEKEEEEQYFVELIYEL